MIALQISLYPVGQEEIKAALDAFWESLSGQNVKYKITPLSTITWSEDEDFLYQSVFKAYRKARKFGHAVMVTTLTTGNQQEIEQLLDFMP
ncbi:MAG: hypothetical protein K9H14_07625 [Actinomycetia bacterium]|nr:hypothetical protein [Actinomycetes bacterium]